MTKTTEFVIENDCDCELLLYIEPESVVVSLKRNETVVVHDEYENSAVTIRVSIDDSGRRVLCVWPGDGNTVVTKDGCDVLGLTH